jgi:hypothetical protein
MTLPRSLILSRLPDLSTDAGARIQTAYERALTLFLEGIETAWKEFVTRCGPVASRTVTASERMIALELAQQIELRALIEASVYLFEAIAAEYFNIHRERDAYNDRLYDTVLPVVRKTFPSLDADRFVFEVLLARFFTGDRYARPESARSPAARRRRGRPRTISDDLKIQALEKRRAGGTNLESARILYQTNRPTAQQVRNVPSILKNFEKRLSS